MDAGRPGILTRSLADLERAARARSTTGVNANYGRFRMAATCPPSTSIHVRGGQAWNTGGGEWYKVPSATFDLAVYETAYVAPVFAQAYYYAFYWLAADLDGNRLYVGGGSTASLWSEHATAAEAEQAALAHDCVQLRSWPPWDYGIPIGCVILRNNGNTVDPCQFQAVDQANRGRSYILRTYSSFVPVNIT
jgi:hypothetical protein